jgi:DNA topoisomerase-1
MKIEVKEEPGHNDHAKAKPKTDHDKAKSVSKGGKTDVTVKKEEEDSNLKKRKASEPIEKVLNDAQVPTKMSKVLKVNNVSELCSTKWWEQDKEEDEDIKWHYLEHKGVIFTPFYKPHGIKMLYNGNRIDLTPEQEEMATYWSQTMGTEWESREIYRKNFFKEFCGLFEKSQGYTDPKLFDFSPIHQYLSIEKEKKKNKTPEEKKQLKDEKAAKDALYGFAIVDSYVEKVAGYVIEPPTLFKGRGMHPKAGFMKARIMPEDVVLNIASSAPVPRCEVPGHCWKTIEHNDEVEWLASYKDDTINTAYKYIFLSASSKFKGMNDMKKYDKARKLKDHIDGIRKDYNKKLVSGTTEQKMLGTATYLIDKLALRVGNEKSDDEADTVGCCSLRVEHIRILPNNQVGFDFLGKDSMRYFNTVTVDEQVWKNMQSFTLGKKPADDLFDRINASTLNDYLRGLMEGLTAKVFRTYNASTTLESELRKKDVSKLELSEKLAFYEEANRQVAILCNHQRTVSKTFDLQKEKLTEKIEEMKEYADALHKHLTDLQKGKKGIDEEDWNKQLIKKKEKALAAKPKDPKEVKKDKDKDKEKKKDKNYKFPNSVDKTKELVSKMAKSISQEKSKLVAKEDNKAIALGTSKLNYNDPRITVRWCKANEVPIEKEFTKSLRSKFAWAMSVDLDWRF